MNLFTEEDLYNAVKKVYNMPYDKKIKLTENAFDRFKSDTHYFIKSMKYFFDKILP